MTTLRPHIELNPNVPATASVIWLHGLGASGHDFAALAPELKLPADLPVRFIFPHAPARPVTINGGYIMPSWYDILSMRLEREINEQQFLSSCAAITTLIDREIERGIDSKRIIVAGFSQGGAVAYQTTLTYPKPLAGLLVLSTYLATKDTLQPHPANRQLPIAMFHGIYDSVVPEALGSQALQTLRKLGYSPRYHSYEMDHEVCAEETRDISRWLQQVLACSRVC
jgi:phospholipase/carboxylesterase